MKKAYRDGRRAAARVNRNSGWKEESSRDLLDQALVDMQLEKEEKEQFANAFMDALADVGEHTHSDPELLSTCCGSTPLAGTHLDDSDYVDYGSPATGMCGDCRDHAEFTPEGDEYDNYPDDDYYDGCGDPDC